MKYYGTEHKRQIGQWQVKIKRHRISIVGNWYSNYGIIYGFKAQRWHDGENTQIIGMDSETGLTKQVLDYIYAYIHKFHKQLSEE